MRELKENFGLDVLRKHGYLNIPALLVHSGRRLVLKLQRNYPSFDRFVAR